jgi:hypothetical protein
MRLSEVRSTVPWNAERESGHVIDQDPCIRKGAGAGGNADEAEANPSTGTRTLPWVDEAARNM